MIRRAIPVLLLLALLPIVSAHVGYVLPPEDITANAGGDALWLMQPLWNPLYLSLMIGTIIVALGVYFLVSRNERFRDWASGLEAWSGTYTEFLPWIARLGLGIVLIGAGTGGVLLSPAAPVALFNVIQILLGFLLLAGLLTGIITWLVLALYAYGVFLHPYLLGNLDIAALCVAILAFGSSRPGIDDLFGLRFFGALSRLRAYAPTILRVGIGVAFAFLAVYEKLLNPHLSELVVQRYELMGVIPVTAAMWVLAAGLIELAVGVALFVGLRTRLFAAIAFGVLSLSFFYFSEAVYSHITLFATLSILFVTGGGPLSIDSWLESRAKARRVAMDAALSMPAAKDPVPLKVAVKAKKKW